jgi:hypothetical protein
MHIQIFYREGSKTVHKNWKQLVTFKEGYELWCKGQKADFVDETQDNLATFRDM